MFNRLFETDESPRWRRICEVGFSLSLLFAYAMRVPNRHLFWGAKGFFGKHTIAVFGGVQRDWNDFRLFNWMTRVDWPWLVDAMLLLLFVSCILIVLNRGTKWALLVLIFTHMSFMGVANIFFWGWALLMPSFLAYLCFARFQKRPTLWPRFLLCAHVSVIYFSNGFGRFVEPGWLAGQMLERALTQGEFARIPYEFGDYSLVLVVLTYATFLLEPLASLLLWTRFRMVFIIALWAMHIGLELLSTVGLWSFILCFALTAFMRKEDWDLLGRFFRRWKSNEA